VDRVDPEVLFQERDGERTRADRNKTNLRGKHVRTDRRKNSFALRIVGLWNNLLVDNNEQQNVEAFKMMIRKIKCKNITRMMEHRHGERKKESKSRWHPIRKSH
jgi:hypothetical protein